MIKLGLRRDANGSAAVEAAIFLPIFMLMTFGLADLGSAMYARQLVNAATQAGATYAVVHDSTTGIQAVMNAAAGSTAFCTTGICTATIGGCTDGSPKCVTVTASYPLTPILPASAYSWAQLVMPISYTITIRVPV